MDKDSGRTLSCKEGVESCKDDRLPNKGFDCRCGRSCCYSATIIASRTPRIAISKAFDNSFDAPTVARVEAHPRGGMCWSTLTLSFFVVRFGLTSQPFFSCLLDRAAFRVLKKRHQKYYFSGPADLTSSSHEIKH